MMLQRNSNLSVEEELVHRTDVITTLINGTAERISLALPKFERTVDQIIELSTDGIKKKTIEKVTVLIRNGAHKIIILWEFSIDWKTYTYNCRVDGEYVVLPPLSRRKNWWQRQSEKIGRYEEFSSRIGRHVARYFEYIDRHLSIIEREAMQCEFFVDYIREMSKPEIRVAVSAFKATHKLKPISESVSEQVKDYKEQFAQHRLTLGNSIDASLEISTYVGISEAKTRFFILSRKLLKAIRVR